MPVTWRRSHATRPEGPDSSATACASTSSPIRAAAARSVAACCRCCFQPLSGSASLASSP